MDLFPTTTQELPALERARRRYNAAKQAFDDLPKDIDWLDDSSDPYWPIEEEMRQAELALKEAELAELQRQKI